MISKPLVSVDDVRNQLPVRGGNQSYDEKIAHLIEVCTVQIETLTNRCFTKQTFTENFNSVESNSHGYFREKRFNLKGMPITANSLVLRYDPRRQFGADTIISSDNYYVTGKSQLITLFSMIDAPGALRVEYTAGYDIDAVTGALSGIPLDLKQACIMQTMFLFRKMQTAEIGHEPDKATVSTNSGRYVVQGGLVREAAALVIGYRNPLVGRR